MPLLLTARPYHFLPLNHDPLLLYWLGTGWWCMGLTRALVLCMTKACPLLMHLPWFGGSSVHSATHPWPLMTWTICWFLIPYGLLLFLRAGPCLIVGFPFFTPFFPHSVILLPFLPYHFVILAIVLFDLCLLSLFWACYWFFSQWLNMVIRFILMLLWAFLTHYIACGLLCPISCFLGILGPFAFFGHP